MTRTIRDGVSDEGPFEVDRVSGQTKIVVYHIFPPPFLHSSLDDMETHSNISRTCHHT